MNDTDATLSLDQRQAVDSVVAWFRRLPKPDKQSPYTGMFAAVGKAPAVPAPLPKTRASAFLLAGVAGSGKTFLIPYIVRALGLNRISQVSYCAYTGKAAVVMKQKHECAATTIHHLIYQPKVTEDPKTGQKILQFFRVTFLPFDTRLIIVDEASMVPLDVHHDLASFGVPILYIGDHFQLPPVKQDDSVFAMFPIDFKLETIHRQAEGNPILRLSAMLRDGQMLADGSYEGKLLKTSCLRDLSVQDFMDAGQVICGYNATRQGLNNVFREWKGHTGLPKAHERLIVLRNNHGIGLMNGQQIVLRLDAHTEDQPPNLMKIEYVDLWDLRDAVSMLLAEFPENQLWRPNFEGGDLPDFATKKSYSKVLFADYAYAITCHKAQGSEWENVILYDDGFGSQSDEMRQRWLYTAVTRASDRLSWVVAN
jgi:exodeoxyribonuclease-5